MDEATGHVFAASGAAGVVTMLDARTGTSLRSTPVGRDPSAVTVSTRANRVYAANTVSGTVSLLDAVDGRPLRTVAVGVSPSSLAVDDTTGRVFVANSGDDSVSVLDAASGAVLSTTPLTESPRLLAVDAGAGRVFVSYAGASTVAVLDAANGRQVGAIGLPGQPVAMTIDAANGHLVVASNARHGAGYVSLIEPAKGIVTRTSSLNASITALGVCERYGRVVVAGADGRVRLLDASSAALLDSLDVADDGAKYGPALRLAVDDAKGRVLIAAPSLAESGRPLAGAGTLYALDARDGGPQGTEPLGHAPLDMVFDGGLGRLFVADNADNTVTVLDAARL